MTDEPLHIVSCLTETGTVFSISCAWLHKVTKPHQTVKLTLHHRAETLVSRYEEVRPSKRNQTAHISLQILSISKSEETKTLEAPELVWRARRSIYLFLTVWSVTVFVSFRPVRGCLRPHAEVRKSFFQKNSLFLPHWIFAPEIACFKGFLPLSKAFRIIRIAQFSRFEEWFRQIGARIGANSGESPPAQAIHPRRIGDSRPLRPQLAGVAA
ncbi:MAG: hypothetical protein WD005_01785 [Haliea sp.]